MRGPRSENDVDFAARTCSLNVLSQLIQSSRGVGCSSTAPTILAAIRRHATPTRSACSGLTRVSSSIESTRLAATAKESGASPKKALKCRNHCQGASREREGKTRASVDTSEPNGALVLMGGAWCHCQRERGRYAGSE